MKKLGELEELGEQVQPLHFQYGYAVLVQAWENITEMQNCNAESQNKT